MLLSKRALLLSFLGLAASALTAQAENATAVDVVKIMSFSCSYCLSSESYDPAIARAVAATGGRFIQAPIPNAEGSTGAAERLYYAGRDVNPALGERIRASLYRGAQEAEVPLLNFMQVYAWVTQDLAADEPSFEKLFHLAQGPSSQSALNRAATLMMNSGMHLFPGYIVLVNGTIKAVLERGSDTATAIPALRDAVLAKVELLSKPNANRTTP